MAKKSESVYRIIDVVGVSEKSWEDAGRIAVETAAGSLRDLRVAEVTKMDKTYGAQIPDDVKQKIIRYLQSNYTPETRKL